MSYGYSGAGGAQPDPQLFGHGFGEKVLAPPQVQQMYQGKKAFFDEAHGVLFDGQQAFIYLNTGAHQQQPEPAHLAELAVHTAYEKSLVLGNGTEGDLEEHANALASGYLLDKEPIAQEH